MIKSRTVKTQYIVATQNDLRIFLIIKGKSENILSTLSDTGWSLNQCEFFDPLEMYRSNYTYEVNGDNLSEILFNDVEQFVSLA